MVTSYKAIVRSVYDGDTIRMDIHLGFGIWMRGEDRKGEAIRIYGINTPEVRGESREEGLKVRDYVRQLLPKDSHITIKTNLKRGKFGRILADVLINGELL